MIRKYRFGTPLPTGAVVRSLPEAQGPVPHFAMTRAEDGRTAFTLALREGEQLFGLGEAVGNLNRRGHRYRSWNMDDFNHTENKENLYCSHNFLLLSGAGRCFGLYMDDPGEVLWDLGFTQKDTLRIVSVNGDFDLYLLEEDTPDALCRAFRGLTGRSYLPPRWAFGYLQSRWGYASETEIEAVAEAHRSRRIPLDGICLDIDYMDHFKDFTWNRERFPDLAGLCARMKADGLRLVPIIDAGIKAEAAFDVFREGEEKGYFCEKADGSTFLAAVWPGLSAFPDFLRPEVRAWFGKKYHRLMAAGIEGFWNDMNEPALFYSPEGLEEAFATVEGLRGEAMEHDASFRLTGAFDGVKNSRADYARFFHRVEGRRVRHDRVHNLYGAAMTAAAADGFRAFDPGKRFLLFSRSGFIGAHRDGGMWMGDNSSWWSHLLLHLKMLPSLNMCGFLYCGADLGGFSGDTTEDLLLRWLQLGVFTPLMRNHSALHTRDQEIYRFSVWEDMRNVLTVRYALLPFLYSEFMQAALTDGMLFRPLAFVWPEDPLARQCEDQLTLGAHCMIAPVYQQNAAGRMVYLPEDMLLVRFRSAEDFDTERLEKGWHWVPLALREFALFIRRGHFIPLGEAAERSAQASLKRMRPLGWLDRETRLDFYEDDGFAVCPRMEEHLRSICVKPEECV